jgi:hypothetical protein
MDFDGFSTTMTEVFKQKSSIALSRRWNAKVLMKKAKCKKYTIN